MTHYWANAGFLAEGQRLRDVHRLPGIPVYMAHGRRGISGPADITYTLARAIPGAELFISETEGHGGPLMVDWMVSITDRLADPSGSSTP